MIQSLYKCIARDPSIAPNMQWAHVQGPLENHRRVPATCSSSWLLDEEAGLPFQVERRDIRRCVSSTPEMFRFLVAGAEADTPYRKIPTFHKVVLWRMRHVHSASLVPCWGTNGSNQVHDHPWPPRKILWVQWPPRSQNQQVYTCSPFPSLLQPRRMLLHFLRLHRW